MKKIMLIISVFILTAGMGFANTEPDLATIQDDYAFVIDAVDNDVTVNYQSVNNKGSYAVVKNSFGVGYAVATSVVNRFVRISNELIVYTNTKVKPVFNKARDKLSVR